MTGDTDWPPAPASLALGDAEVHVWRASLDSSPAEFSTLAATLAPEEREKAARFHFEKDARQYTTGRGILRALLGRYLGAEPSTVPLACNSFGKPELAEPRADPLLRFNLTHSHGLALYAFTRGRELGIDLEFIRPDFATEQIAERFFAPEEVRALRSLPAADQPQAFFNCWTRKEAFIKAHGKGLSIPLDQFVVTLAPGAAPALVSAAFEPDAARRWSLRDLHPGPGYVGALAAEGDGWALRRWRWLPL